MNTSKRFINHKNKMAGMPLPAVRRAVHHRVVPVTAEAVVAAEVAAEVVAAEVAAVVKAYKMRTK